MSGQLQAQWRGVERTPSPTGVDPSPTAKGGVAAHTSSVKQKLQKLVVRKGVLTKCNHPTCTLLTSFLLPATLWRRTCVAHPRTRHAAAPLPRCSPAPIVLLCAHRPHHGGRPRLLGARWQHSGHGLHAGHRTCWSAGVLNHHQPITNHWPRHPNWRQVFWCLSVCKSPSAHAKES